MKKLMFAAAVAATGMTVCAASSAQVYDVTLSLKTTKAVYSKINSKTNPFITDDEMVIYRTQASQTWKGLIWGCDCETISGEWKELNDIAVIGYSSIGGCIMWDTKTKKPVFMGNGSDLADVASVPGTAWGWDFINAIDKNGNKVEGAWTMEQDGLSCDDSALLFSFKGAGFGSLKLADDCSSYIKTINGNFAGYMKAPYLSVDDDWSGCTFCGYTKEEGECDWATAWDYCDCLGIADDAVTAAYGTWKIAYNAGLSKKLSTVVNPKKLDKTIIISITQVYNFKALPAVEAAITAVEMYMNDYDPTGCDELEAALATAKANTAKAQAAADAVSYESLKADQVKAAAALTAAEANKAAADTAYEYAAEAYTVANDKYETAVYNQTNVNATIIYKNASQEEVTIDAVGCAAITANINKFEAYTLVRMETSIPGLLGIRTSYTWAQCKAVVAEYEKATVDAKAALTVAEQNKVEKYEAQADAAVALVVAQDAKTAADNNLGNIAMLQWKAAQDLEKAETVEAAAQKAYDDNKCGED